MLNLVDFVFGVLDRAISAVTGIFRKKHSMFTSFYDVKTRSKVSRPVLYKTVFTQLDGDNVFAVEGKSWDGRRLVRFVTKEDFYTIYADIEEKEDKKDAESS